MAVFIQENIYKRVVPNKTKVQKVALEKENDLVTSSTILYWMSRDQRLDDNYSLQIALDIAKKNNQAMLILFVLNNNFLNAKNRHFEFMLEGLNELQEKAKKNNLNFLLIKSNNTNNAINEILKKLKTDVVVADFSPLKTHRKIIRKIKVKTLLEVDNHNIVPYFIASQKQEFGAYTIRPKIKGKLSEFLVNPPKIKKQNKTEIKEFKSQINNFDFENEIKNYNDGIKLNFKSGELAAKKTLNDFINNKIEKYNIDKNFPNKNALSNLSAYLHFGQISSQRIAYEVKKSKTSFHARDVFLEELIIRKELSDNYCFYNENYDNIKGAPNWALETLRKHEKDFREYNYSFKQLENAKTHDEIWNFAQAQLTKHGKMHGYLRMYWAKKILEWTKNPSEAIKIAIKLNDMYSIDGRDPNGYVGIMWSVAGLHDRAWGERPIFGKVRYMGYLNLKKKLKVS